MEAGLEPTIYPRMTLDLLLPLPLQYEIAGIHLYSWFMQHCGPNVALCMHARQTLYQVRQPPPPRNQPTLNLERHASVLSSWPVPGQGLRAFQILSRMQWEKTCGSSPATWSKSRGPVYVAQAGLGTHFVAHDPELQLLVPTSQTLALQGYTLCLAFMHS